MKPLARYHLRESLKGNRIGQTFWLGKSLEAAKKIGKKIAKAVRERHVHSILVYDNDLKQDLESYPTKYASPSALERDRSKRFASKQEDFDITPPSNKTEGEIALALKVKKPKNSYKNPLGLSTKPTIDQKEFIEHAKTLTPEEKKALAKYKDNSDELNIGLRKKNLVPHFATVKNLDRVFSHKIQKPLTVYRGIQPQSSVSKKIDSDRYKWTSPDKLKPGTILKDNGYMSTSLSSKRAAKFSDVKEVPYSRLDSRHHIFNITLPKGTQAYFIDHDNPAHDDKKMLHEQEVVLNRGHVFRVTHHSTPNDYEHHIHLEIVKHDPTPANDETVKRYANNHVRNIKKNLEVYKNAYVNGISQKSQEASNQLTKSHKALQKVYAYNPGLVPKYKDVTDLMNNTLTDKSLEYKRLENRLKKNIEDNDSWGLEGTIHDIDRFQRYNHEDVPHHSAYVANVMRTLPEITHTINLNKLKEKLNSYKENKEKGYNLSSPADHLAHNYENAKRHAEKHGFSIPSRLLNEVYHPLKRHGYIKEN